MAGVRDIMRVALPRGSARGHIARELATKVGLAQGSSSSGPFNDYIHQVEPTLFVPPVRWDGQRPLLSVVIPFFNTPDRFLRPLLDAVMGQSFVGWELIMADASTDAERAQAIRAAADDDPRFRYVRLDENGGISRNTNAALPHCRGDYVVFTDHDDLVCSAALNEVAVRVLADPTIDVCYSDEDVMDESGRFRHSPFFKPAWSPHMFLQCNYTNHLSVIRRTLLEEVGGLRPELDGAQDYDLLLRLHTLARPLVVAHIPKILYHWRQAPTSTARSMEAKPYAVLAGQRALGEYLERLGVACAGVEPQPARPGWYHVRPRWACRAVVVVAVSPDRSVNEHLIGLLAGATRCQSVVARYVAFGGDVAAVWAEVGDADAVAVIGAPCLPDDPAWLDELVGVLALPRAGVAAPLVHNDDPIRPKAVDAGWFAQGDDGALQPLYAGVLADGGGMAGPTDMVRDADAVSATVAVVPRADAEAVLQQVLDVSSGVRLVRAASGHAVLWGHQRFTALRWPLRDGLLNANLMLASGVATLDGKEAA